MAMLEPWPTVSFLHGSLVLVLGVGCRTASAASALREGSVWHNWDVSVYLRRLVEWWWGLRAQEPVLLGDGGRDALAVCHVRWLGASCSSPVTVVMVSGGGAAVFGAGAMAVASRRGAVRARLLAAAMLRRRSAGAVPEGARTRREAHAAWEMRGCCGRSRCGAEEGNYSQRETVVAPCRRVGWSGGRGGGGAGAGGGAAAAPGEVGWHGSSAEAALQRVVAWRQHPGRSGWSGSAEARRRHRCGWQWSGGGARAVQAARRRGVGGAAAGGGAAAYAWAGQEARGRGVGAAMARDGAAEAHRQARGRQECLWRRCSACWRGGSPHDGSGGVEAWRWRRCGWRWCDSGAEAGQAAQRRGVWRRCGAPWRGGSAQAGQEVQRRGGGGAVARGGAAAAPR